MQSSSPTVLDRCCLRCWALALLLPGVLLVFWALSSLVRSLATLVLTDHWVHPTGQQVARLFPTPIRQWLTDPQSLHGVHAVVSTLGELPLAMLSAIPGSVAVALGLCLWEEARREALAATEGEHPSPGHTTASQLSTRNI